MKRINILFVLAVLSLASCNKESVEIIDDKGEGFSFSLSTAHQTVSKTKSSVLNSTEIIGGNGLIVTLSETESASEDNVFTTKSTPIEDLETFRDNIQYIKVWGYNNDAAIPLLSSPQMLKNKGRYYYPVDGSDNYLTIIVSDLVWKNPKFYAFAPATPTGTMSISSATKSTFIFNYTMPEPNPSASCDAQAQNDILTGVFTGDASDLSNNIVPLTFDHPLSAIRFKLGTVAQDFTIHTISLKNVYSTGTCTVNISNGAISWANQTTAKTYVQTFEQDFTTSSPQGMDINDDEKTKTFFAIPYNFPSGSNATIEVSYFRDGEEEIAYIPLREKKFEPGKTYTFTISALPGPWVDFTQTSKVGGNNITDIQPAIDDSIYFNYPQGGGTYEKFIIPVKGLKVGKWYNFDFTELIKPSKGTYWNGANGAGIYACRMMETPPTSDSRSSMITYYGGTDADDYDKYIWFGYEGSNGYSALRVENNILTFKATKKNMYWVWDVSKCNDSDPKFEFIFTKNVIEKIIIPSSPAVDYLNSDHYGFHHEVRDVENGYSTFKTNASFGTSTESGGMEFHAYPNNSYYEKMNIPLINLTSGARYRIDFKYKFERISQEPNAGAYFGYRIGIEKDITKTKPDHSSDNFQNLTSQMSVNTEYSVSYEFDATDSTMYWIWDMSKFEDNNRHILYFYDTRITEI